MKRRRIVFWLIQNVFLETNLVFGYLIRIWEVVSFPMMVLSTKRSMLWSAKQTRYWADCRLVCWINITSSCVQSIRSTRQLSSPAFFMDLRPEACIEGTLNCWSTFICKACTLCWTSNSRTWLQTLKSWIVQRPLISKPRFWKRNSDGWGVSSGWTLTESQSDFFMAISLRKREKNGRTLKYLKDYIKANIVHVGTAHNQLDEWIQDRTDIWWKPVWENQ